tara:strand:- start:109 stop:507 length:399 start_codon:yes stop_codon:yes gene_type:complete
MGRIGGDPVKEGRDRDPKAYAQAHERIYGPKQAKVKPGRYIYYQGKMVHIDEIPEEVLAEKRKFRQVDNVAIESGALGCAPHQIPEFKQELAKAGIDGVKFKPNGNMIIRDRATRFKVMKARKMHDKDEIRG